MTSYEAYIKSKSDAAPCAGLDPGAAGDGLYPHQTDLVRWALRKGRAAVFADTGLGKTAILVRWAQRVSQEGRVLILAPLAVAEQTVREAAKFGVDAVYRRADQGDLITVTNYEMMQHFDLSGFVGVVLDESSILKSYTGSFRNALIEGFAATPYRLACTATPAPNDFTELGNHAEFLGVKTRTEMLAEYFTHDGGSTQDWRVKGHAVGAFWRWVASWGAVVRKPSDLGHADERYDLAPVVWQEHVIAAPTDAATDAGLLFAPDASTLADQRAVRRSTMTGRAERVAELVASSDGPWIVWCELNDEADLVTKLIPGAVQISGSDDPDVKSARLLAFSDGAIRVLVTKPKIAGFGLNWQHCSQMVFVGASHSYEQTYQALRRCWRFGQTQTVTAHIIRDEREAAIVENYRRKERDAAIMGESMIGLVRDIMIADVHGSLHEWNEYQPNINMAIPSWLASEAE